MKINFDKIISVIIYSPVIVCFILAILFYWICSIIKIPFVLIFGKNPFKTWVSYNKYFTKNILELIS
jgi:hypothetical protein